MDPDAQMVCAFCRQEISRTILTPCCEAARRCQEANVRCKGKSTKRQRNALTLDDLIRPAIQAYTSNVGIERPMKPQEGG